MTREEAINVFKNTVPIESNEKYAKNITEAIDMAIEALSPDKISRAELFNKLATVHAPMEANEYKAEVYRIINEL